MYACQDADSLGDAMQDRELLRMVAFKLQDTAKRLDSLASQTNTALIRAHFGRVARVLREQELKLLALPVNDDGVDEPSASALPDADRTQPRRRAVS